MGMIWDILNSMRKNLVENLDVRTVIIGDGDIPASLMPAARIFPVSVISNSSAEIPMIFDLSTTIEFIFLPKTEQNEITSQIHIVEQILNSDIYPVGCEIKHSPSSRISRNNNSAKIELTIRWYER